MYPSSKSTCFRSASVANEMGWMSRPISSRHSAGHSVPCVCRTTKANCNAFRTSIGMALQFCLRWFWKHWTMTPKVFCPTVSKISGDSGNSSDINSIASACEGGCAASQSPNRQLLNAPWKQLILLIRFIWELLLLRSLISPVAAFDAMPRAHDNKSSHVLTLSLATSSERNNKLNTCGSVECAACRTVCRVGRYNKEHSVTDWIHWSSLMGRSLSSSSCSRQLKISKASFSKSREFRCPLPAFPCVDEMAVLVVTALVVLGLDEKYPPNQDEFDEFPELGASIACPAPMEFWASFLLFLLTSLL
mmetsp:Transcript_17278/g.43117  ORF Transcript_17278/g.43117 Transcript_17278/m.43117 type:complete len:305 (-) Transcript_17278:273-1187(-)